MRGRVSVLLLIAGARATQTSVHVDLNSVHHLYDGHGGLSDGAFTLLIYPVRL